MSNLNNIFVMFIGAILVWIPIIIIKLLIGSIIIAILFGLGIFIGIVIIGEYIRMKITGEWRQIYGDFKKYQRLKYTFDDGGYCVFDILDKYYDSVRGIVYKIRIAEANIIDCGWGNNVNVGDIIEKGSLYKDDNNIEIISKDFRKLKEDKDE